MISINSEKRKKECKHIYDALIQKPIYPICIVNGQSPYDEQIMSMPDVIGSKSVQDISGVFEKINGSFFFFIFNFENYYHFIYDTLPYLYFYFDILKINPDCRLLLPSNHSFLQFQKEFFEILGIDFSKIEFAKENTIYKNLHVPTSLTHGKTFSGHHGSNLAPEPEARIIWDLLFKKQESISGLPNKIYISRRSHVHGDMSNIGTNYTTRRKCLNEDELVELFKEHGYEEVFAEKLTTHQKIEMFQNATHVAGFIGGGMANLLFAKPEAKSICIETPDFLRINTRFKHSMNHTNIAYLNSTYLASYDGKFPLYTRLKVIDTSSEHFNKIGELESYRDNKYYLNLPAVSVAGFSLSQSFDNISFNEDQLTPLDYGLNSPFMVDINNIRNFIESNP